MLHGGLLGLFAWVGPGMGRPSGRASMGSNSYVLIDSEFESEPETQPQPPADPEQDAPPPVPEVAAVQEPATPEIPEMRPGVDGGAEDAAAWLASQSELEHRGLPSTVEQPALTQEPGLPTPPSAASPPSSPSPASSPAAAAPSTPVVEASSQASPSAAAAPPAAAPVVKGEPDGVTKPTQVPLSAPPLPIAPGTAPREAEAGPELEPEGEPEAALPRAAEPVPDPKELKDGPSQPGPAVEPSEPAAPTPPIVPAVEVPKERPAPNEVDGKDPRANKAADPQAPSAPDERPEDESDPAEVSDVMASPRGEVEAPQGAVPEGRTSPDATERVQDQDASAESALEPVETPADADPLEATPTDPVNPAAPSMPVNQSDPSAASPASNPSPGGTTPGDRPFERADRDVDPTSVAGVGEIRFGRVTARDGLEVLPARPRFSHTVRFTTLPRNPMVRVTFNRAGRVTKAEFVRGRSTGYPEVDGPLLTAMYRWTARGAKLREIGPTGVTMTFKVLLREERELGVPQQEGEGAREGAEAPAEDPDFAEPRP